MYLRYKSSGFSSPSITWKKYPLSIPRNFNWQQTRGEMDQMRQLNAHEQSKKGYKLQPNVSSWSGKIIKHVHIYMEGHPNFWSFSVHDSHISFNKTMVEMFTWMNDIFFCINKQVNQQKYSQKSSTIWQTNKITCNNNSNIICGWIKSQISNISKN